MKNPANKTARARIRLSLPLLIVLPLLFVSVLVIYSSPALTEAKKTSGNLSFTDGSGSLINGTIEISMTGAPSGGRSNVNSITWRNAPNAWIYFDVLDKKSVSINLRVSGDSPNGRVSLEDYGAAVPGGVDQQAPGIPVKYVELRSTGVSFADADVSIHYTNAELKGLDEKSLVIYSYYGGTWNELISKVDPAKNLVTATVDSLSIFAVSTQVPNEIAVRDTRNNPVISHIKTYDEFRNLKKEVRTSALATANVTGNGELEVDALESKNVAVRLKLKGVNRGEVVLDDFGKKNPVSVALPGAAVKYVEIGARNISFSSANITIRYTDAEMNGGSEDALTIYHWNGASWDAVPTIVDKVNKTLSTSSTSLSYWGVATLYQKALRCDTGTSIGTSDTTDTNCGLASYTVFSTGLLLDPAGTTGGYIQFTAFTGERLYGYFVDNTAYSTDVNITGINGSMSMRLGTAGNTGYGKYQLGYYDPNGAADNFVGLFNSTETSGVTTATITRYPVSFNNQFGIIPKNMKLAIRVWTRTTASLQPRFYLYRTTTGYDSSINYTISTPNASISGYITNKSSGLPLSGALVQTNTSLNATTNASGYYIITGVSNGTYIVNASLQNYATNSTNVTINGADITNANISLSPLPTYLVSGYVTNASSGAAISGANVTTNTSQTTTTNSTGYYNLTLSNGTYLITASKTNYNDNSTTITVNGAAVSNANIMLNPLSQSGGKLLISTNRYVVLDDWQTGTASTNYVVPNSGDATTNNNFIGKQTTIGVKTLLIDSDGNPLAGKTVNFTIYRPGGTYATGTGVTDSSGVASYYRDLSGANFWGNWTVKANYSGVSSANSSFVYNWWGCAWNQGSCAGQHSGASPSSSGTTSPNSPYTASWEQISVREPVHTAPSGSGWAADYCTVCHQAYDGNPTTGVTAATTTKDFYTPDVHRTIRCDNASCHNPGASMANHNAGTITIGSCRSASCHPLRSDISMKSTLNGVVSNYSNSSSGGLYDDYHTPNSTVPCIICHGPMHNVTKPDESQRFLRNNNTESTQCTTCHQSYNLHNNTVNCTLCHSDDVHAIKVFAQNATYITLNRTNPNPARGNCTNCHQNSTFYGVLKSNPNATNQTGRNPPQVAVPMEHSNNNSAGTRWNQTPGYWTNSLQLSWCLYCHGNTTHSATALGRPADFDGINVVNSSISLTSSWCSSCHWQGYTNGSDTYGSTISTFQSASLPVPPEITGNATYANKSKPEYFNHSDISIKSDNSCYGCHRNGTSAGSITDIMHNLTDVSTRVSGSDCISCHDYTKTDQDALHRINNTDMKAGVHANLNKNATNSTGISADNKKCWGCHTSNGSEPRPYYLNYYNMGDRFANPYRCYDCHNSTGKAYTNVSSAPAVYQHFRGGSNVTAASSASDNSSSCVVCHNVNELKVWYAENDIYNTGLSNASHYTTNRTDMRNWDSGRAANCSYCHQNSSTAFDVAMLDPSYNSSIQNHSASNSPACYNSTCHKSGWIHNITLTRPQLPLPNTTYCLICHANKQKHNNTQECSQCHINQSSNDTIHPIKFIQIWSNFSTTRASAANCTNCHQSPGISGFSSAPIIPNPLKHSSNISNGSIWNSTSIPYWTSGNSPCYYCHSNTKHNQTALGNISALQNSINVLGGSLTTTRWCADCHYNDSSNPDYKGNRWNPVPPLISINNTGKNYWVNHSRYFAGGYNDSVCEACHVLNGSYGATSLNYSHSLDEGVSGGPNCIICHNLVTGLKSGAPVGINFTAANASVHFGMNGNNATNRGFVPVTGACWACHDSDGNVTSGHPDRYMAPKTCTECHLGSGTFNVSAYNAIIVSQHYYSGKNITAGNSTSNISSCINCHENVSEMIQYNNDTDTGSFTGDGVRLKGGNGSFYHYGRDRSDLRVGMSANCSYCHQNSSTAFAGAMVNPAYNRSIQNHSTGNSPACYNSTCHNTGWIHNTTLARLAFNSTNTSSYCQNCHGSKQKHNGTQDCNKCHINQSSSDTIHPIKYLQINRSFLTSNSSAVNCTNCHQTVFPNFTTAPIIPDPLKHSSNSSNGTIWGTYWNSEGGACYYCHSNTKHNSTALGNISALLNTNNVKNGSLATTRWCVDCHYNDSVNANYKGDQWNPAPPLITVNNTGKSGWINHSSYVMAGYNDTNCENCHALNGSYAATSLNYSHSLDEGVSGGPDCISCHYIGSPYHNIDNITANSSAHFGMNSVNATKTGIAAINGACWACHDTDGNITNNPGADIMGDIYSTPKTCTDCHLSGGIYYSQAISWGGLTVSQHYQNGTSISAGNSSSNISSCINCHENVSEMLLSNSDPDTGTFTGDGVRLTGGNRSFYHYGKNRTELRAWNSNTTANCSYCHQNTSTAFAIAMIDPAYNRSISNHSSNYNSSNPTCYVSLCHNTGWIHNSTLSKPATNSTFCLNCHGKNTTSGLINFTGAVTSIKEPHNNSVSCAECHMNTSKDVHPVKYLRQDATYSTINTSAVTCITCHQTSSVDSKLTLSPPNIPLPMHHSDNASNGTIWNSTVYWTPANPLTSCTYCHNDTKHNATALGRPAGWKGNNVVNSSLSSGTWCASCHYKNYASGGKNYSDMTGAFTTSNLPVPPEITNGSYAIKIFNRSNYYNHSLKDYTDSVCRLCHGVNLSSTSTLSELMHNISGASCTGCHYSFEAMNNTTRPDRYVDISLYNTSLHRSLSCTNCHTQGHKNIGARKACEDCHAVQANPITDKDRHNITPTPSTYFVSGNNVVGITDCTVCHDSALLNMSISTYGYWKQKDCDYCHTYPDKYYE